MHPCFTFFFKCSFLHFWPIKKPNKGLFTLERKSNVAINMKVNTFTLLKLWGKTPCGSMMSRSNLPVSMKCYCQELFLLCSQHSVTSHQNAFVVVSILCALGRTEAKFNTAQMASCWSAESFYQHDRDLKRTADLKGSVDSPYSLCELVSRKNGRVFPNTVMLRQCRLKHSYCC